MAHFNQKYRKFGKPQKTHSNYPFPLQMGTICHPPSVTVSLAFDTFLLLDNNTPLFL